VSGHLRSFSARPVNWLVACVGLTGLSFTFGETANSVGARTAAERRPVTVADTIETRRALSTFTGQGWSQAIVLSPDGTRYAMALTKGDLQRNGVWLEIVSGGTQSIEDARPTVVGRLFTKGTGTFVPTHIAHFGLTWLRDNRTVVFLWNDGDSPTQVTSVNVDTRAVRPVTNHPTDVVQFSVSDSNSVIYTALPRRSGKSSPERMRNGFAVGDSDVFAVLRGDEEGPSEWTDLETFVLRNLQHAARKVVINGRGADHWIRRLARFSPDGNRVIVEGHPQDFRADWSSYRNRLFAPYLLEGLRDFDAPNQINQIYVVDLRTATSRPLWDAPVLVGTADAVWSPDGRKVIVGPTFLPLAQSDWTGLAGIGVAEVDVATGRMRSLPIPSIYINQISQSPRGFRPLSWSGAGIAELKNGETKLFFKRDPDGWHAIDGVDSPVDPRASARVRIEIREDPNTPPALFALDTSTGRSAMVLDLNPTLRTDVALTRVEVVNWSDEAGRTWHGKLFYPVNYTPNRRFPLVIQTHGYSATEFSLIGYEPLSSTFAAQPLASRDVAVLQMEDPDQVAPETLGTVAEAQAAMLGYEGAVKKFSETGLADPARVGLVGWSRTGWHIEYTLTHSCFPYAAALVADNVDYSYVQYILDDSFWRDFEQTLGAAPATEGLKLWAEASPGFNAERIQTPLRMQVDSGGLPAILSQWEVYSRLRRRNKPVELYVIPDIAHGVHGMVIPRQQFASRAGMVQWMDFWLNGREDTDSQYTEQYARWRRLRDLHSTGANTKCTAAVKE
jgi:dipeptidyl aminopeptidase/acylaminoacyl peptidase